MNNQIELPIHDNLIATSRSLKADHPSNLNLYTTDKEFADLLREVKIRFDTNPKFYQREDYLKLIELIRKQGGGIDEIKVNTQGEGNVVTEITAKGDTLTVNTGDVKSGGGKYPRVRWARRGFIDLTNCKDIDYIIVPCRSKQLCLYVTNLYLKKMIHIETYESIYGDEFEIDEHGHVIPPEDFTKVISKYFDNYDLKTHTYIEPRVIEEGLDFSKLPANIDSSHFICCKEFCRVKKCEETFNSDASVREIDPLKLMFWRKDIHNGFIQFPYFLFDGCEAICGSCLLHRFVFTPYMEFANPFNGLLGGVIPIKNGKLLIDLAFQLKNQTVELVTSGELIWFDEQGICSTLFNPNTFIYTTNNYSRARYTIRNKECRRSGSAVLRKRIRMSCGMERVNNYESILGHSPTTTKYRLLVPMIVPKRLYRHPDDFLYVDFTNGKTGMPERLYLQYPEENYSNPSKSYLRKGYRVFDCGNPVTPFVHKYFKAPYDRMNMYTINKYAGIIRCQKAVSYINDFNVK